MIKHTIEVETKFDEGEKVFFIDNDETYEGTILSIEFYISYDGGE